MWQSAKLNILNIADTGVEVVQWCVVAVGTVKVILAFSVVCCDAGYTGGSSDGDSD